MKSLQWQYIKQSMRLSYLGEASRPFSAWRTAGTSVWPGGRRSDCGLLSPAAISGGWWDRGMAKKGKGKAKSDKQTIEDLIDELSDDEDDIAEDDDVVVMKETELSKFLKQKHPGKK